MQLYRNGIVWLLSLLIINDASAQQIFFAGGGELNATGGNLSMTIGEWNFTDDVTDSLVFSQGIQQPFDVPIIINNIGENRDRSFLVFPNPTQSTLIVELPVYVALPVDLVVTDVCGKVCALERNSFTRCTIELGDIPTGVYLLSVYSNTNSCLYSQRILKL